MKNTLVGRLRRQNSFYIIVIPLSENHFLFLKILPRNLRIDSCIANILKIKHHITIIL